MRIDQLNLEIISGKFEILIFDRYKVHCNKI